MIEIGGKLPATLKVERIADGHVELSSPDGWRACLNAGDRIDFHIVAHSTTSAWWLIGAAFLNLVSFGHVDIRMKF